MTAATRTRSTRKPISDAERERRIEARKEQTEKLQAGLAAEVEKLGSSDEWKRYLDFAQSFHSYSFYNMILIMSQHPSATRVAGFKQWQEKGRQVRKGEKSIKIYGFAQRKITETDDSGREVERKQTYFPLWSVFAEDQTDPIDSQEKLDAIKSGPRGNPKARLFSEVPQPPARLLEGADDAQISQAVINHIGSLGWTFEFEQIPGSANGYTMLDKTKKVAVEATLSPAQTSKTALHELAHLLMHSDPETGGRADDAPESQNIRELEAESVAYIVAGTLGLDTSDYSIGYLTSWSGGNGDLVKSTAERVLKTANKILEQVFPLPQNDDE